MSQIMLMGWLLPDNSVVCTECDDWFEHEDWIPIYQNSDLHDDCICRECGAEL